VKSTKTCIHHIFLNWERKSRELKEDQPEKRQELKKTRLARDEKSKVQKLGSKRGTRLGLPFAKISRGES